MSQITSGVLSAPVVVPPGTILHLSVDQATARSHRLSAAGEHKGKEGLGRYRADSAVAFKAGESLAIEGEVDKSVAKNLSGTIAAKAPTGPKREKRDANGDTPEMAQLRGELLKAHAEQLTTAKAEGVKAGRLAMLEEIKARNAVFDAAETAADAVVKAKQAHDAEPDADKRKPLQQALDAAIEAQLVADKAVDDLPEIEA